MARNAGGRKDLPVGKLALAAIGVVYGDIGTSPLYAIKECFAHASGLSPTRENVLGILSIIFWSVTIVVSLKYITYVMRADNRGEGGDMALLALALRGLSKRSRWRWPLVAIGMCGTGLFYGDGMITPAISVLSAVEGLEVATPLFQPYVVPIAIVVIIALFMFQRFGTAWVGGLFGPVMCLWFVVLTVLGALQIAQDPGILVALSPTYAFMFFWDHHLVAFFALGAVTLALTGAEALYADMGHFGRKPIRLAWFGLVLPALMINYFGQGALVLRDPAALVNPFFNLVPTWGTIPLVMLATIAAVIASQAVISGAFSITRQAIQLGYCPRLKIRHTSESAIGQIYISQVNNWLMVAVIALVLAFRSSSNIAAAYGIAVTGAFITTTLLSFVVVTRVWGWRVGPAALLAGSFLLVDVAFFSANCLKLVEGGWFPLVMGLIIFALMTTWKRGSELLREMHQADALALDTFLARITDKSPLRVKGTAVYMTASPYGVPAALLHNLKHNKVLHDRIVILNVRTEDIPFVAREERIDVTSLDKGFVRVQLRYGFMEDPDVPAALAEAAKHGLEFDMMDTSFFLGRETLVPARISKLPRWRERLFIWMARNGVSATEFFRIPTNRVVELGAQVEF